ncbi:LysR substrate-binding domain-containing protein [Bradyrhizobium mercantei]|uniref:LysR substrate-binding domain-containing protein n=1 Tax=Bradyrhizobium mercantei TaxID=1904807 RepID=UPI0009773C8E|nr:LysR substrate-binding domain-containing protein [Bradyrhizobium mercantei]
MNGLGLRPKFLSGGGDERLGKLTAGDLDFAIFTTGARDLPAATARLHRERFVLVATRRRAEPLRASAETAIREGAMPILAYAHSLPIFRRYWSEVFGRESTFQATLVMPDLRALIAAAAAGTDARVVPDYCLAEIADGRLVQHDHNPPLPPLISSPHGGSEADTSADPDDARPPPTDRE